VNTFAPERFAENIQRLALGVEPVDAGRRSRVTHTVEVAVENVPQPPWRWRAIRPGRDVNDLLPRMKRHESCRYVLCYRPDLHRPIDVRLVDRSRRYVPRRLRFPIHSEADVIAGVPSVPLSDRVRRPVLFPGAAYDIGETATGLRGRVLRDGLPMRWARVEARLGAELVGRAHGDDRGDFLLLIDLPPTHVSIVTDPLVVTVQLFGPDVAPTPSRPDLPDLDPCWDLPLEQTTLPGATDPVSAGTALPATYRQSTGPPPAPANLPLGRLSSAAVPPFQFT
jgi:hypothetical protein